MTNVTLKITAYIVASITCASKSLEKDNLLIDGQPSSRREMTSHRKNCVHGIWQESKDLWSQWKLNLSLWIIYIVPGLYFLDMENSPSHNLHLHQDVQLHEGVDQADCTLHWWPLFYLYTILELWLLDKINQLDAASQLKCQCRTVKRWILKIFLNKRIFSWFTMYKLTKNLLD
jgi:hypothetical protein